MAHDSDRLRLLESLARNRGIPFGHDRLPRRKSFSTPTGRRISYLSWPGQGAPLVLLHGGALTAHTWDLTCLDLTDDFCCVCPDLRGHGDSDAALEYSIQGSVDDVLCLVDDVGWDELHIAGMSLGGTIAFHLAAQQQVRVLSLTMIDVGPGVDFEATAEMRSFLAGANDSMSCSAVVDAVMKLRPNADRDLISYRYQHLMRQLPDGTWTWRQDRARSLDYQHVLAKIAEMPQLAASIRCPVLIVRGDRSRIFSTQHAAQFARMFSEGQCVVVPHAGHNVQEDNPRALAETIRARLDRRPGSSAARF